jgi:MYXO-CTERM domain-containing protein
MKRRICSTLAVSLVSTVISQSRAAEAMPNEHQVYGEEILDTLNSKFYDSKTKLYYEQIDSTTGAAGADSFLWPATHMLRALMWAAMVDPAKYKARLESYLAALPQYYQSGARCYRNPGCYGSSTGGGTPFFDDNALLDSALTDIYQKVYPSTDVLDMAITAFEYVMNARDVDWTVPQLTSQLGQGLLFSMATTPTGLSAQRLVEITGDQSYAFSATTWYDIFTDFNVKMMDQNSLLLNQGSFCWEDAGTWSITNLDAGTWSLEKQNDPSSNVRGFRAYQTSYVVELAVKLYADTHDVEYLQEAQAIASSVLHTWYKPGAGFSEISFWGGNDSVDMLMDLHGVDPDPKWFDAARDIVDFIIKNGRDTAGYYPNGAGSDGTWNIVRTGKAPPSSVAMMPQAAAANAILRVAWCEQDPVCASADGGAPSDAGGASDASVTADGATDGGSAPDAGSSSDATIGNAEEGGAEGATSGTSPAGSSSCACSAAGGKRATTSGVFALLAGLATGVGRRRRAGKPQRA